MSSVQDFILDNKKRKIIMNHLKDVCEKKFCTEIIYFLKDYKKLEELKKDDHIHTFCEEMYEKYIHPESDMELNIPSNLKKKIKKSNDKKIIWKEIYEYILHDVKYIMEWM